MSNQIVGAKLDIAYTRQEFTLGALYNHPTRGTFMFLQADGAVIADTPYTYDEATFQIEDKADVGVLPLDTGSVAICVSPVALADNEYAWVFVGPGYFNAITDATGVTAAQLITYISATVGTLTSGATAALLKGVSTEAVIAGGATGTFYAKGRLYSEDLP